VISIQETENPDVQQSDLGQPGGLSSMVNHYANAIPQTVLYLPSNPVWASVDYLYRLRIGEFKSVYGNIFYTPYSYAKTLPYWWWDQWDGKIATQSWIYLGLNIGLISIGLYQTWKKDNWNVVVAILALAAIISVYVLILRSGGRFMQTVDWITAMFLSVGLVHLGQTALKKLPQKALPADPLPGLYGQKVNQTQTGGWLYFALIVIIGSSPVIAELMLQDKYPDSSVDRQVEKLFNDENSKISQNERFLLQEFLDDGGDVIYGEALYPRYFPPDAALMTLNETLFSASTTLTIAGPELNFVVLPRLEPPTSFPQGAETLVFGCRESSLLPDPGFPCLGCLSNEFEALAVIQYSKNDQITEVSWRDGDNANLTGCPLERPED